MSDTFATFLIGIVLGVLFTSVVLCSVFEASEKGLKIEAVERGHAIWKVDNSGAATFEWKEIK